MVLICVLLDCRCLFEKIKASSLFLLVFVELLRMLDLLVTDHPDILVDESLPKHGIVSERSQRLKVPQHFSLVKLLSKVLHSQLLI